MKKKLISILFIALLAVSSAFAQSNSSYTTITLPFTAIAGGITTNLFNGWTNITTYTNIVQRWDSTNGVITNTTNTVSYTNVSYASFTAANNQNSIPIVMTGNSSDTTTTSNVIFSVVKSIDNIHWATNTPDLTWETNSATGTAFATGQVVIDMTGYRYGRIYSFIWSDTNTLHFWTNSFLGKSEKPTF